MDAGRRPVDDAALNGDAFETSDVREELRAVLERSGGDGVPWAEDWVGGRSRAAETYQLPQGRQHPSRMGAPEPPAGDGLEALRHVPYITVDGANSVPIATIDGELTIGRHLQNSLRLDQPDVSRFHARILPDGAAIRLVDLGSKNGTYVNGNPVRGPMQLHDGDLILVAGVRLTLHVPGARRAAHPDGPTAGPVLMATAMLRRHDGERVLLLKQLTTIGRGPQNDIVLRSGTASRAHARIEHREQEFVLTDLNSTNGTFVNRDRLARAHTLRHGDEVHFAGEPFTFWHATPGQRPATSSADALTRR
ncbi:MAG: FHA domain-containing protein [Chloroflexi bacterium]|nr:FHA domain-containing protein [Chloroflexota bacterium]